jgi:UDP-sulfoquinovose synthase
MRNNVIVFGGDGFCGWPTALRLSYAGYNIIIVDNLARRKIDIELECESLTPIKPITQRIKRWRDFYDGEIRFVYIDVAEHYHRILTLFKEIKPIAVVHFAEQRAAPYSMKSSSHKRYTVDNNIRATHNILCSIVESGLDIHMVHLGTMGVYGYNSDIQLPEGYLKVKVETDNGYRDMEILYPADPGSIYHMTKTQDALLFYYYNKNDNVKITDLHQGIVWGTNTVEASLHTDLINRFDYDGDFGTVLNRFIVQSVVGHPLTVYGTGGQTRAFIHIENMTKCVELAIKNPPKKHERVRIFNQTTEAYSILDLAKKVSKLTGAKIGYYDNPRNEAPKNDLSFYNTSLMSLGLSPITINDYLLDEVRTVAKRYSNRCDISKILPTSFWKSG